MTGILIFWFNYIFDAIPEVIAILPAFMFFLGNVLLFRLARQEYRITLQTSDPAFRSSFQFLSDQWKVMIYSSLLSASSNFFWMYPRFVLQKEVDSQDIVDFSFVILFMGSMQSIIVAYIAGRVPIFRSLDSQRSQKVFTNRSTLENLVICAGLIVGLYFSVVLAERQHLKFLTFRQMELLIPVLIVWTCLAFFVASRTNKDDLRFIFILNFATLFIVIMYQIFMKAGFNSIEEFIYAYFLPILLLQLIGLVLKFHFSPRSLRSIS